MRFSRNTNNNTRCTLATDLFACRKVLKPFYCCDEPGDNSTSSRRQLHVARPWFAIQATHICRRFNAVIVVVRCRFAVSSCLISAQMSCTMTSLCLALCLMSWIFANKSCASQQAHHDREPTLRRSHRLLHTVMEACASSMSRLAAAPCRACSRTCGVRGMRVTLCACPLASSARTASRICTSSAANLLPDNTRNESMPDSDSSEGNLLLI